MLNRLFSRTRIEPNETVEEDGASRLDRLMAAYGEWRITQDIAAIMSALDRLSDRRLAMIGLRRDDLYDAVTGMMEQVREQKRISEEVLALLEQEPATGEKPRLPVETAAEDRTASEIEERAAA